ncbi:MAG: diaminopropionate ammonia-lyase, partial [Desulfovibrionales bacterium]|nr:diaminopropionate ammonia-lyase [Desulfovibrionales bacterium]
AGQDPTIVSGESGAIGTGVLYALAQKPEGRQLMNKLGMDENSVVWVLNTEGNTDPVNYQKVVWEGKFPMAE